MPADAIKTIFRMAYMCIINQRKDNDMILTGAFLICKALGVTWSWWWLLLTTAIDFDLNSKTENP